MRHLFKYAFWTAALVTVLTVGVGIAAYSGVKRIPILEYLLWPGGMVAWGWHGDNYHDSMHFLSYAIPIGIVLNLIVSFVLGMGIGILVGLARHHETSTV